MKSVLLLVLVSWMQGVLADDEKRQMLSAALIAGSPWSFSNVHVSETEYWRRSADGSLETMSSYAPDVWVKQQFTEKDTIVRPSRAGGNTITYSLDKDGNAVAIHSKNPSVFKSMKPE
jgi:hypothetical protein